MEIGFAFLLKKAISVILMPLSLGVVFVLLGVTALIQKAYFKAKLLFLFWLVWSIAITHAFVADILISPLESHYSKLQQIPSEVDYVLLLGGDKERRGWEALRLFHLRPDLQIITSGYSPNGVSDANKTAQLLIDAGVPKEKIVMQEDVKDTREEAWRMQQRVGNKPFILVTSAYHMPRAMMIFADEGLTPIASPTDFRGNSQDTIFSFLSARYLQDTEHAWHEYLGLLWLKLKGKQNAL